MKDTTWFKDFNSNQYFATLAAYMLVLIMNISTLFILIRVGEQLIPGWDGTYAIWFGAVLSLEAIFTNYLVMQKAEKFTLLYRVAEFLIIVVALKLILILRVEWDVALAGLYTNFIDPSTFFSGEFLAVLFIFLSIWGLSIGYATAIRSLQSYQSDLVLGEFIQIRSERLTARRLIANLYLLIGLVLITLVTIFRLDLSNYREIIGETLSGVYAIATAPLIIYFLAGLILLSLSHFAILRGAWLMGRIPIASKVAANWFKYTVLLFGAVAVLTLLLPTEYTNNFLASSYFVLQFLIEIIMFILGVLVIPFIILFGLISSLLSGGSGLESQPKLPQFEPPATVQQTTGGLPPWFELLKNLIFWILLTSGMLFFIWYYIRQNQIWLAEFDWQNVKDIIGKIGNWIKTLFSGTGRQIDKLKMALLERRNRTLESASGKWILSPVNLKKMNAREKILFYYNSFLEENAKNGFGKKPSQTPAQYANQLVINFPQESESLEIITKGFEAARYSRREIKQNEANQIEQIRRALNLRIKEIENNLN